LLSSRATTTGQQLAYVYFENEPGRRSAAKLLERDEASDCFFTRHMRPFRMGDIEK
jgi:hypothetical protein